MSLLVYNDICELIEQGVIKNTSFSNVNGSSLDLVLGGTFITESPYGYLVDTADKSSKHMTEFVSAFQYKLGPGEFVLAHTIEQFDMPLDLSGEYMLKSTQARNGLEHLGAGWVDPGWSGVLTLEFKNMLQWSSILLRPGQKCGQMKFFRHAPVPEEHSYRIKGQYNGDMTVTSGKGIK